MGRPLVQFLLVLVMCALAIGLTSASKPSAEIPKTELPGEISIILCPSFVRKGGPGPEGAYQRYLSYTESCDVALRH